MPKYNLRKRGADDESSTHGSPKKGQSAQASGATSPVKASSTPAKVASPPKAAAASPKAAPASPKHHDGAVETIGSVAGIPIDLAESLKTLGHTKGK